MDKKTKKQLKKPQVLGVIFVVIALAVGYVIPNMIPAAAFIETLAAILVMTFGYTYLIHEELTKEQRKWMAGIYFVVMSIISITVVYTLGTEMGPELGENGITMVVVFTLVLMALISAIVYMLLGIFSKLAYSSYSTKKHKK
jgi:peptidoglycan biosynthesis protein MviN/MurJ (putative lipid II flippase)